MVRSALLYLVAALLLGAALAALPALATSPAAGALRSVYIHLLVVGWVAQLIFGVAFWMFPRLSPESPRGSEPLAVATYALLNAGLLLRAVAEPASAAPFAAPAWSAALVASALLQLGAALCFAANTWGRVKVK